jgi:hypothetical protein
MSFFSHHSKIPKRSICNDPAETTNIWDFSSKHPIAQRRSYSCDNTSMCQANRDISHLLAKFLPSSYENRSYPPRELFATPCCWCLEINAFDFFHIQGLHIFASTLSDLDQWICMAWITDFSFNWLQCS